MSSRPPEQGDFSDEFYYDADLRLLQAIPPGARDILDTDCRSGRLAEVLKHLDPARRITSIAPPAFNAQEVAEHGSPAMCANRLITAEFESAINDCPPSSFDCILVGHALLCRSDPSAALALLRPLLRAGGHLLAALPNAQHWTQIDRLLRGEPGSPKNNDGAPDRAFTAPSLIKTFLDAGYLPRIIDRRQQPAPEGWLEAMRPNTARLGLDATAFAARTRTLTFIIDAQALADTASDDEVAPITLGACTNNAVVLSENLLASACLHGSRHEVLTVEGAGSAGEGLNAIIEQAQHELVVLAHQDVYLPRGWVARLWQQYEIARQLTGDRVGVMGVYGVRGTPAGIERAGRVADRDFVLDENMPLPAISGSLDELLLIVPKRSPLRFDPALGFHLYGTDIALAAERAGLVAVVIDAPCHHNSQQGDALPPAFAASAEYLRAKWPESLPIVTPCMLVR